MADFLTPVHKEIDMDKITIERETLAGMIYPPKPPPRLCGYIPDGSGVEWNAYDTMQMEAYARAAYADGFAAALAAQPAEPSMRPLPDHDNHHNALKCPYCNPRGLKFAEPAAAQPADIVNPISQQEPVAWIGLPGKGTPLYAAPPAPAAVPPDSPAAVEYIAERLAFDSGVRWRDLSNSVRNAWRDIARKKRLDRIAAAGDKP